MTISLRPYQIEALTTAFSWIRAGKKRFILQSPTGSGKTICAARMILAALKQNARVLFVAHRSELLDQAYKKLLEAGVDPKQINMIVPGVAQDYTLPIHVASVQSLAKRRIPDQIKLIIIDEAHRSAAKSYSKLFELPNVTLCGMTATPSRLDNKPLDMFEDILVVAQPRTLIDQGFIVEPRTFTVPDEELPDLTDVHMRGGDYDTGELDDAVMRKHLVGSIVAHWKYRAEGLRTIVSANSIKHSLMIVEQFLAEGIPAEHVDGESTETHRKGVIDRLRSGETLVVSQVGLWVEGVDIPEAKCLIMARPTKSLTVHLQIIGRIVRPYGGITPIVLDHAGNTVDLGLMSQDRTYSLYTKRRDKVMEEAQRGWRCDTCLYVNLAASLTCAVCGTPKPIKPRKLLRTVDGTLVEVGNTPETERQYWDQLWRRAYTNGELGMWVVERFKKRFDKNPPDDWGPSPRQPKPFVWLHAAKDARDWTLVCYRQGMSLDWARKKLKMKYDIDCDPSMSPRDYVNTLHEPAMAEMRERVIAEYKEKGLEVPAPVKYGATTRIPGDALKNAPVDLAVKPLTKSKPVNRQIVITPKSTLPVATGEEKEEKLATIGTEHKKFDAASFGDEPEATPIVEEGTF